MGPLLADAHHARPHLISPEGNITVDCAAVLCATRVPISFHMRRHVCINERFFWFVFYLFLLIETIVAPVTSSNNQERGPGKESDSLRICNHCLDMLECRRRVQIEQMIQPIICQLYSHLQKNKFQIQNSVDMYNKVSSKE